VLHVGVLLTHAPPTKSNPASHAVATHDVLHTVGVANACVPAGQLVAVAFGTLLFGVQLRVHPVLFVLSVHSLNVPDHPAGHVALALHGTTHVFPLASNPESQTHFKCRVVFDANVCAEPPL